MVDRLIKAVTSNKNIVFVRIPGVQSPKWPSVIHNQWRKDFGAAHPKDRDEPWKNHIYVELTGTTFSGHSTRTTLGNTLRSLFYMYYYLEEAGFKKPWSRKDIFIAASGDDVVIWFEPAYEKRIVSTIMSLTSRTKISPPKGLGQCIEEYKVSNFHDIDFCSKTSYSSDGTLERWVLTRDLMKLFTQKRYYTGQTQTILSSPTLHKEAILSGLVSEKISHAVEDILRI